MAPVASALTRVLVTGFGPFQGVPDNPSWGIASRLPTSLPNNIELIVYPSAIPVAYHPVINLLPGLVEDVQPDLSLHIGVAAGRTYFAVEQTSSKNVYSWAADVDGQVWEDSEGDVIWSDQPAQLSTDLDLHAIVADWQDRTENITWPSRLSPMVKSLAVTAESTVDVALKENAVDAVDDDVRWSDAVGSYLCAFIYYAGMVVMGRREVERKDIAFMHIPLLEGEEELGMGVDITVELVQALVQSWREQREGDEL